MISSNASSGRAVVVLGLLRCPDFLSSRDKTVSVVAVRYVGGAFVPSCGEAHGLRVLCVEDTSVTSIRIS